MGDERVIRIVVADDHPLFRRGIVTALDRRDDFEVVGEADNGADALELVRSEKPEILMLDVQMPGMDGLEALNVVVREKIDVKVMLLTGHGDSRPAYEAMALGAGGYISKNSDVDRVCEAARSIARGQAVIGDEFQSGLVDEIRLRERGDRPTLTDREREVLSMTSEGSAIAGIAAELHLSEATVKTHLHHAYEKLGVSDRAAAVARAMRWGLID